LNAMDLYGPATFFRLHIVGETFFPAALLQFALLFPQAHRLARWRMAGYGLSLAIFAPYEVFLYQPSTYSSLLAAHMPHLGAVGSAYVAAVVVFNLILRAGAVTESPAFPVVFTLAVLLLFNPVRTRLQAFVDRVFFGTRYDGARVLAALGSELASTLQRDRIG